MAQSLIAEYQKLLLKEGYGTIKTVIKPLEKFYEAEEYHQDYLVKNLMATVLICPQVWYLRAKKSMKILIIKIST